MKLTPIMNYGRWLVICPAHPGGGIVEVRPEDKEFICPLEYPGIIAVRRILQNGRIVLAPDTQARKAARSKAEQDGAIHEIVFPSDYLAIEDEMKLLPVSERNWTGG